MRQIRSYVGLLAVSVLAVSLLAGCGGGSSDSATAGTSAGPTSDGVGTPCANPGDRKVINGVALMCDKKDKQILWLPDPYSSGGEGKKMDYPHTKEAPPCPTDLTGLLTSPLVDPADLAFITPLGNVSPPGHTAPIDHQYVTPFHTGHVALRAPADGWIVRMQTGGYTDDGGKTLKLDGFVFAFEVCQGFVVESTGNASMDELNPAIRALLPADPTASVDGGCKFGIHKSGHRHQNEWMCYFQDISLKMKAGDLLATLNSVDGPNGPDIGMETWAANYNVEPPANGIHWDWYSDNRYIHSTCLYDLFTSDLVQGYQAKYGGLDHRRGKGKDAIYYRSQSKAKDPLCGTTTQDTPGTLLGYWFGAPDTQSKFGPSGPQYGDNAGISFIRNNVDPDIGEVVEGGGLVPGSTVVEFSPRHTGLIDRDPVEVTPGTALYCYNAPGQINEADSGKVIRGDHRFVLQLVDATHVTVDLQKGTCGKRLTLGTSAVTYLR